jgi:hypothetical protein
VAKERGDRTVAQRRYQTERVFDHVGDTERCEIAIVVAVPARGAAEAALVGGDHVVPGVGERQHHLAPTVGNFWETVQ